MCDPKNRNILVWNVCAWNPFHSAVSRVLIVRLHSCIIRVCIGLVRTIAGANKSNGHPPSTSPSPQLTCMQSVEFYGQLGKISDNPRNHEQRGSNEGLSKSLLYRIYEEIITWPMHACCMWTLVLDSGSVCCGLVTTHFHAPCTSQPPLDWQSLNWTFQTQHSIFHFVSSIPYFCGNLRICSCPSFVLQ